MKVNKKIFYSMVCLLCSGNISAMNVTSSTGEDKSKQSAVFDVDAYEWTNEMLPSDVNQGPFVRLDPETEDFEYMSAFHSLDLTPDEEDKISEKILKYAKTKGGIPPNQKKIWKLIAESVQYQILIYACEGNKISKFYEYGSKFVNRGLKRLYVKGNHYQMLKTLRSQDLSTELYTGRYIVIDENTDSTASTPVNSDYFSSGEEG